jgi:hypothetical protein
MYHHLLLLLLTKKRKCGRGERRSCPRGLRALTMTMTMMRRRR